MSRFRKSFTYWCLVVVAAVILTVGIWAGFPPYLTVIMTAIPLAALIVVLRLRNKETTVISHGNVRILSRGVNAHGEIVIDGNVSELPDTLRRVVTQIRGFRLINVDAERALVRRSWTLKTWGARISLQFAPLEHGKIIVSASNEPIWGGTVIDYGQAEHDIKLLLGSILHSTK